MRTLALVVEGVLLAVAGIHIYWAVGGRWGLGAVLPERAGTPLFRPGPWATLAVAVALVVAALLVGARAGLAPSGLLPAPVAGIGSWLVAAAFLARAVGDFRYVGLFRRVRDTRFAEWDGRAFTPLALGVGLATALIALGPPTP